MVLGNMPDDARMCKHAFNHASQQGLCASTARCPQQIFKEDVHERGMKNFVHFQPPRLHCYCPGSFSFITAPSRRPTRHTVRGGFGLHEGGVHPGVPDSSLKWVF